MFLFLMAVYILREASGESAHCRPALLFNYLKTYTRGVVVV